MDTKKTAYHSFPGHRQRLRVSRVTSHEDSCSKKRRLSSTVVQVFHHSRESVPSRAGQSCRSSSYRRKSLDPPLSASYRRKLRVNSAFLPSFPVLGRPPSQLCGPSLQLPIPYRASSVSEALPLVGIFPQVSRRRRALHHPRKGEAVCGATKR